MNISRKALQSNSQPCESQFCSRVDVYAGNNAVCAFACALCCANVFCVALEQFKNYYKNKRQSITNMFKGLLVVWVVCPPTVLVFFLLLEKPYPRAKWTFLFCSGNGTWLAGSAHWQLHGLLFYWLWPCWRPGLPTWKDALDSEQNEIIFSWQTISKFH